MSKSLLFTGAVVAAVALSGVKVYADDAGDIYSENYNTYSVYDNEYGVGDDANQQYPVITAIVSQPGSIGGRNYTGWALLTSDQTGSMDLFVTSSALANLPTSGGANDTAPAVGDAVSAAGQYQMYHSLPEMVFSTVVSSNNYLRLQSRGNPTATISPLILTCNQLNTVAGASNVVDGAFYIELQGVTFSGGGTFSTVFPTYANSAANVGYTLTDGTGSLFDYDYESSYYACSTYGGTAVPTGPVNVYGFISVFPSTGLAGGGLPEFTVTQIVPEPSAFVLAGMGLLGLLAIRRRRS